MKSAYGAALHGQSVHKAQTSDHFGPLPNGDGGGRGRRGLSVYRRGSVLLMIAPDFVFFSDCVCSMCHRQTVQVQSVLGNVRSMRSLCHAIRGTTLPRTINGHLDTRLGK